MPHNVLGYTMQYNAARGTVAAKVFRNSLRNTLTCMNVKKRKA